MSKRHNDRIVTLQKALKVAKEALKRIEHGVRNPESVAEAASYEVWQIETQVRPGSLAGLCGHERIDR